MRRFIPLLGLLTLGAFSLMTPPAAYAQVSAVPNSLNFQGRLATPEGNPVPDGTYNLRLRLYDAVTDGNTLHDQSLVDVPVKNGVFAVQISGFTSDKFNGNTWLGISINGGADLAPRTSLVSVPYAIKSNLALTVPENSITTANLQSNAVTSVKLASDPASLFKVSGGAVAVENGNLAMGSTGKTLSFTPGDAFTFDGKSMPNYGIGWFQDTWYGGGATAWFASYGGIRFFTSSTPRVNITRAGNVGINKSDPATALDITGTATVTGFRLSTSPAAGRVLVSDANGNGTWGQVGTAGIADAAVTNAKIAAGTLTADRFASGVIPSALPPSGAAGGDLSGTYPNPALKTDVALLTKVSGGLLVGRASTVTLDQSNEATANTPSSGGWQSFTPAISGRLYQVDVFALGSYDVTNITLNIYAGQGTGGTLLSSQSASIVGMAYAWQPLVLASPPTLTAGQTYTFSFGGGDGVVFRYSSNFYSRGISSVGSANDFRFRTYMGDPSLLTANAALAASTTAPLAIQGTASTALVRFGGGGGDAHHLSSGRDIVFNATGGQFTFRNIGNMNNLASYTDQFTINSNGSATLRGALTQNSDARYKKNVADLVNPLDLLLGLRGFSYEWNGKEREAGTQIGFIAQEVEKIFPELVTTDKNGYKSVNYIGVIPVLVEAVKSLKKDNDELKARIDAIEHALAEMKSNR